jgi:hypothetical protein
MRNFVAAGEKFSAHGMTWVAAPVKDYNAGTGIHEKRQVWMSKKTWLFITCCFDVRRETITWKVDRFSTAKTRAGAAALAASMTREQLDLYVGRLAVYGTEKEKRSTRAILKLSQRNDEDAAKEQAQ